VVVFESADDGEQVGLDGAVHLGEAGVAVGFGAGNQCAGGVELLVVLRQELGGGDEDRAGQAGFSELSLGLMTRRPSDVGSFDGGRSKPKYRVVDYSILCCNSVQQ
jgi:hypothetical protein